MEHVNKMQMAMVVIVIVLSFGWLSAEMITPVMATTVAQNHVESMRNVWSRISQLEGETITLGDVSTLVGSESNEALGYIIELKPRGFVVISGNTELPPILAYSFRSQFPWSEHPENILLNMVRTDLSLRLDALDVMDARILSVNSDLWQRYLEDTVPMTDSGNQWPPEGSTSTGGWVETTWSQRSPWWNYCPKDPSTGERCVVGCVATAMAQIINYHSAKDFYLDDIEFIEEDRYRTDSRRIKIDEDHYLRDFPDFPTLNGYLDTLAEHYSTGIPLDDHDLATLSFASGVAIKMDYSSEGSAAHMGAVQGELPARFGYFSTLGVDANVDWFFDILNTNMKNGLPAELSIDKSGGAGHAVVCDGLRESEFSGDVHHINFGWGPYSPEPITEAWYILPPRGVLPEGYNVLDDGIINIRPPDRALERLDVGYDDGVPDRAYYWDNPGYRGAVRITPPSDTSWKLKTLRYYFGRIYGPLKIRIFADSNGMPGPDLIEGFTVQPHSEWKWYDVDVSSYDLQLTEDFYIAVEYIHTPNQTSWAYDEGDNGRSWHYFPSSGVWVPNIEKTYFMRAVYFRETGWEPGVEEKLVLGPREESMGIKVSALQSGSIEFSYDLPASTGYLLKMFDVSGCQVLNQHGSMIAGSDRIRINPVLAEGVYFWQVSTEFGEKSGKLIYIR